MWKQNSSIRRAWWHVSCELGRMGRSADLGVGGHATVLKGAARVETPTASERRRFKTGRARLGTRPSQHAPRASQHASVATRAGPSQNAAVGRRVGRERLKTPPRRVGRRRRTRPPRPAYQPFQDGPSVLKRPPPSQNGVSLPETTTVPIQTGSPPHVWKLKWSEL